MTNDTEAMGALYGALSKAQGTLREAAYDRQNPHLRNRYATLASVLEAVRPALAANGLAVVQLVGGEAGMVSVTTVLGHAGGGQVQTTVSMAVESSKGLSLAQAAGVVVTYLRRYSLMAIVGISSAEDDTDGDTGPAKAPTKVEPKPAATGHHATWAGDRARFCARLGELGVRYDDLASWLERHGKPRPSAMPSDAERSRVLQWVAAKHPDEREMFAGGAE